MPAGALALLSPWRGAAEQHIEGGVVGGVARVATVGRMFEADIGDLTDQVRNQASHDRSSEPKVLLARPEEVKNQRLAGQEIVPQAVGVDDRAHFPVSDFPPHQRDQDWVDQVDAGVRPTRLLTRLPRRQVRPLVSR
jgi:hypothetical protein